MRCEFNTCELLNGIIFSILPSILIAFTTYWIVNRNNRKRLRKKFDIAAGKYIGYGFEDNTTVLSNKIISEAEIKYIESNVLYIKLQHDNLIWEGNILMELETFGSVAWRYINLPFVDGKEQHQFGLKKCIIRDDQKERKVYVYLIGDKLEGYGKEVLIREY